jgi:hypothetical protein
MRFVELETERQTKRGEKAEEKQRKSREIKQTKGLIYCLISIGLLSSPVSGWVCLYLDVYVYICACVRAQLSIGSSFIPIDDRKT